MDDFMDWLYFHYIMPTLESASQGEYQESIARLKNALDLRQGMDYELAIEFYANTAFRLGLRTGFALNTLISDESQLEISQ